MSFDAQVTPGYVPQGVVYDLPALLAAEAEGDVLVLADAR